MNFASEWVVENWKIFLPISLFAFGMISLIVLQFKTLRNRLSICLALGGLSYLLLIGFLANESTALDWWWWLLVVPAGILAVVYGFKAVQLWRT